MYIYIYIIVEHPEIPYVNVYRGVTGFIDQQPMTNIWLNQ